MGVKRKIQEVENTVVLSRKRIKREVKKILKQTDESISTVQLLKPKKIRRQLEKILGLPKKSLDDRKQEIKELITKAKQKLVNKKNKMNVSVSTAPVVKQTTSEAPAATKKTIPTNTSKTNCTTPPKVTKEVTKVRPETIKWREDNHVTLVDEVQLEPFQEFTALGLESSQNRIFSGFQKPTPIQAQSWPYLLKERDVIGVAQTGSGKTLAFVLPLILKIEKNPERNFIQGLILAPTRELAAQIEKTIESTRPVFSTRSVCVGGGVPRYAQIQAIKNGVDIIVATPGRLLSYVRERLVDLSHTHYVVLDEADRMLEQGFVPDVTALIDQCKPQGQRHTLLFSATWPAEVQALGRSFLQNPVKIQVSKSEDNELSVCETVTQTVLVMKKWDREDKLYELLNANRDKKIIVFGLYKKEVENLGWSIKDWGFSCDSLHGNKDQRERNRVMAAFRSNKIKMLIATDVASRGLDVKDVDLVINFTFPLTVEDYVHRIGRTGRAGKKGDSITFFTDYDKLCARDLIELLEKTDENIPPQLFKLRVAKRFKRPRYC